MAGWLAWLFLKVLTLRFLDSWGVLGNNIFLGHGHAQEIVGVNGLKLLINIIVVIEDAEIITVMKMISWR